MARARTSRVAVVGAAAVVMLVLASLAGAVGRSSEAKVLSLAGNVVLTHMDGPWVAVHEQAPGATKYELCESVSFWNVATGARVGVRTSRAEVCADSSNTRPVEYMGFAGGRVVWTSHEVSRLPVCHVYTATVQQPKAHEIPECVEDEETGYGNGEDVGAWWGDGPLLVGNVEWDPDACSGGCTAPSLVRVRATKLQHLRNAEDTLYVRSVDAGRIVVLRDNGAVAVFDSTGRQLRVLSFPPKQVEWAAVSRDDLVVKKARSLEVYGARSGKLRKTWTLRPGSRLFDVDAGIAVLVRDKKVQLLRLVDGHGDAYSAPGDIESADLEAPGLVYAYNAPKAGAKAGRVVFVPAAQVAARLR